MLKILKSLFKKSAQPYSPEAFNDYVNWGCYDNSDSFVSISPLQAYRYFQNTEILRSAISTITDAVLGLSLVLYNEETEETIAAHEILDFLQKDKMKMMHFWQEIVISSLLTEESWFVFRGFVNKPPVDIVAIRPYNITVWEYDINDGNPMVIEVQSPKEKRKYYKIEIDDQTRYIDSKNIAEALNELVYISGIENINDQFRGMSPLSAIYNDLEHLQRGKTSNTSLLKKGFRPSVMMQIDYEHLSRASTTTNVMPTEAQKREFLDNVRQQFQGDSNTGKLFFSPFPLITEKLSQSNREADYIRLLDAAETAICRLYKIPLPLVKTQTMTYANYQTAIESLYNITVNGIVQPLFAGVMQAFKNRYDAEELSLIYKPHEIKVLQAIQAQRMEQLRKTQSLTTNEIRSTAGYEVIEDGDNVLVQGTLASLSELSFSDNEGYPDE